MFKPVLITGCFFISILKWKKNDFIFYFLLKECRIIVEIVAKNFKSKNKQLETSNQQDMTNKMRYFSSVYAAIAAHKKKQQYDK